MTRSGLLVAAAIASSACVVPPLRAGAGGGAAAGGIITSDHEAASYDHGTAALGEVRAAFTPLSLADDPPPSFDVGVGAALDFVRAGGGAQQHDMIVAPFAEGVWFAHAASAGAQGWRLGPTVAIELPFDARPPSGGGEVGFGASAGVLAEVIERVDGPIMFGGARGALGIGVALRGGVRVLDGDGYSYVLVTLEVRVPGMAALPLPAPRQHLAY